MCILNVLVITSVILHVTGEPPPQAAAGNQFIQGGAVQNVNNNRLGLNVAGLSQKGDVQRADDLGLYRASKIGDTNTVKPKSKKRKRKRKLKQVKTDLQNGGVNNAKQSDALYPPELKEGGANAPVAPNNPVKVPEIGSDIRFQQGQVQNNVNNNAEGQKPIVQNNGLPNSNVVQQQQQIQIQQQQQQQQLAQQVDLGLNNQNAQGIQGVNAQNFVIVNQGVQVNQVNQGVQNNQQNQQPVIAAQNNQDLVYNNLNQVLNNQQQATDTQQNNQNVGIQNADSQNKPQVQQNNNQDVQQQQGQVQQGQGQDQNSVQRGDIPLNTNNNNVNNNINNDANNVNSNNINTNQNNNFNNDNNQGAGGGSNQGVIRDLVAKSRENLRILWDWSDFLVNYEQYVMPEQKVRRAHHATTGEPWPLPQYYVAKSNRVYRLDKDNFQFKISKETCDIIVKAIQRYKDYILNDSVMDMYDNFQNAQATPIEDVAQKYEEDLYTKAPVITSLTIKIRRPCTKYPSDDLFVKRTGAYLWANEVWGAIRGLETFSQLVFKGVNEELYVKDTVANDYPRFQHRGVLLDTSRHYIFKEVIFDVLEGMAQNKMNGAFHPSFVYTHEDIAEIIEFARYRGIRVMPEFDTPGHTYSWGLSRPDLLTQCYQGARPVNGYLGPLDPSKNETYRFLRNLFNEIIHRNICISVVMRSSNPDVLRLLNTLDGKPDQPINLQNVDPYMYSYDIRKVLEHYENSFQMTPLSRYGRETWVMYKRAIDMGYNTLYSTCWYLDLIEYGVKWPKYYTCDPADTSMGYQINEKKVLGGEACLWAEYIDNENLMTMPRASATAERLWSSKDVKDVDAAGKRLQEHRCRMLSRGLSIGQISGPDYCLRRGKRRHHASGNCTGNRCGPDMDVYQVEKINVKIQRQGRNDCNQLLITGSGVITLVLICAILVAVAISIKMSGGGARVVQVRFCRNKTIFIVFLTVLLVYFICYTSLWMQVMEFKGTFEKRIKSSSDRQ
ncbi:hypothetical protein KUTeg_019278 [Tegillarca granosa]|uniref:beta-N-acetylhexosaminidase n=1 Tax=Tegillarca granosa TaxID=220873 RepID=A0ABQ9EG35_TEGGR|nr:hypothetical protein KUTeg_019278 [Tegillarca granosa]